MSQYPFLLTRNPWYLRDETLLPRTYPHQTVYSLWYVLGVPSLIFYFPFRIHRAKIVSWLGGLFLLLTWSPRYHRNFPSRLYGIPLLRSLRMRDVSCTFPMGPMLHRVIKYIRYNSVLTLLPTQGYGWFFLSQLTHTPPFVYFLVTHRIPNR